MSGPGIINDEQPQHLCVKDLQGQGGDRVGLALLSWQHVYTLNGRTGGRIPPHFGLRKFDADFECENC